jgi:hypothetical protein
MALCIRAVDQAEAPDLPHRERGSDLEAGERRFDGLEI